MAKSPAFQFYPSDYLGSARVAEMTLEEEGAYIRALLYCWNNGSLPADVDRLARIIGKGCSTSVATSVQRMFSEDVNDRSRLVHDRLDAEREKQEAHRSQRSEAGKRSAELRKKDNERYNDRSTSVEVSLQRKGNSSSSSSITSTDINTDISIASEKQKKVYFTEQEVMTLLMAYPKQDQPKYAKDRIGKALKDLRQHPEKIKQWFDTNGITIEPDSEFLEGYHFLLKRVTGWAKVWAGVDKAELKFCNLPHKWFESESYFGTPIFQRR